MQEKHQNYSTGFKVKYKFFAHGFIHSGRFVYDECSAVSI